MQKVANKESKLIQIAMDDIKEFFSSASNAGFVERVRTNAARYVQLFYEVIDKEMPVPTVNLRDEDMTAADVIMEQRIHNLKMTS